MRRPLLSDAGVRRGVVAPLTLLTLAIFVAMLAIVFDGGALMAERGHAHSVADAAALAGAADLFTNWNANAGQDTNGTGLASALSVASADGYTNDGVSSTVTVTFAPNTFQGGPNAGSTIPAGSVEVLVQANRVGSFCSLLQQGTPAVRARSVARGMLSPISEGVILLNLSGSKALNVSGASKVTVTGASLRANSGSSDALDISGSSSVAASGYSLVQGSGYSTSGSSGLTGPNNGSATVTYEGPISDPLRYLAAPSPTALSLPHRSTNLKIGGVQSVDLYPGVYDGGIQINGMARVRLHGNDGKPGVYYLNGGGLTVSDLATVTMDSTAVTGVMIYNAWHSSTDQISIAGLSNVTINPPTQGPYTGISIFQGRGSLQAPAPAISVGVFGVLNIAGHTLGVANLRGTVYAPYANLTIRGLGDGDDSWHNGAPGVNLGQCIVDTMTVSNNAVVTIDRGTRPVGRARLVGFVE